MIVNNNRAAHHEPGRRTAILEEAAISLSAPPTEEGVQTLLDAVCRSVTELARVSPARPARIKLQHGQTAVEVEWAQSAPADAPHAAVAAVEAAGAAVAEPAAQAAPAAPAPAAAPPAEDTRRYLCAPMVGTFYHAPEPDAPPFVSVGDVVRPGQTVGILEVMKMMSPIEADVAGRVVEILVPDGQAVEFQQRLVSVEPVPAEGGEDP